MDILLQANSNLSLAFAVAKCTGSFKDDSGKKNNIPLATKEILLSYLLLYVVFYQQPLKSTMSSARHNCTSLSVKNILWVPHWHTSSLPCIQNSRGLLSTTLQMQTDLIWLPVLISHLGINAGANGQSGWIAAFLNLCLPCVYGWRTSDL